MRTKITTKRAISLALVFSLLASLMTFAVPVFAEEGGDQMLDGIGETALVLRYVFDGNAEDWTRNGYNGVLRGNGTSFIEDGQFGTVLSLPGGSNGNYVQIPGDALIGLDTVSVTGWIYAKSFTNYQRFFDFGQNTTRNFWVAPTTGTTEGYRARITTTGWQEEKGPMVPGIATNEWVHLAIVLDTANRTIKLYENGVLVGQEGNISLTLEDILHQTNPASNLLYIGKSQYSDPDLNANLYDFRVYSIALNDNQVSTIYNNALSDETKVRAALSSINLGNLNNRTSDINLPTESGNGAVITWESSMPEYLSTTGKVTRPLNSYEEEVATVVLTATATLNEAIATREFTVTIPRLPSDEEVVALDKAALDLGDLSAVIEDIILPTKGEVASTITWTSSNEDVISTAGVVTRPAPGTGDAEVTLTATISYGTVTDTKVFNATVIAMPTDEEIVQADLDAIDLGDISDIIEDIELPTKSVSGFSTLTWSSSNEDIISSTGVVTRPAFEEGSQEVILTVTATKGDIVRTKEFIVTVRRLPNAPILISVPDIEVETVVGVLPKLPYYIPGEYMDGKEGPLVRVNWPAPTNNNQVLEVGSYTVKGVVPGTDFQATATVIVKEAVESGEYFNINTEFAYADGKASKLEANRMLTADVTAENISGNTMDAMVILALYDPSDRMVNVSYIAKTIAKGAVESMNAGFTLPADVTGYSARVFVWEGLELDQAFVPLTDYVEINAEGVIYPEVSQKGPEVTLEPFPMGNIVLEKDDNGNDTQFIKNRDKFVSRLAQSNPDSYLYMFRHAFGQPQPAGAQPLGGWDTQTTKLRGHATGHYLTALAQAYASASYDEELQANFLDKMNYMIDVLYDLSQMSGKPAEEGGEYNADPAAVPYGPGKNRYDSDLTDNGIRTDYWNWGEGFISAYPPDQFIMLEHGATYGGSDNQIWAPYYTLHKILAGLMDCYEVGGNEKALEIAKGMGTWVYERLRVLPESTLISMWNRYIAGEYGGMNEAMARLAELTGDDSYIECAKLFDNISFFFGNANREHGLAKNVDTIRGKHANQHIPQITGALQTYDVTGEIEYYNVAENFWDMMYNSYMYSIGGVAGAKNPNNSECFTAEPNTLFTNGFSSGGQNETCATYNLLKLSRSLFMHDQDAKYMDYYEQALYNHILASVAENNPGNTYHVPLNPGSQKGFGNGNMNGYTCCNGTAIESSTKLQDSIYFKSIDNTALYVNLYVPSTLTWTERDVVIRQSGNFPYDDSTKLTINGSGKFDINVRVPKWATNGFFVKINGEEQAIEAIPGTYLTLSRTWADGDTIELEMPFSFYLSRVMDQPNIASIFYGPVVLAVEETRALPTWRKVTLDPSDIGLSITGDPSTLRFTIKNSANDDYNNDGVIDERDEARLKPFYEFYTRHSVYVDVEMEQ